MSREPFDVEDACEGPAHPSAEGSDLPNAFASPLPGRLEQLATRLVFLVIGVSLSSWAPLVPLVKTRLGLDEGRLGGVLLCLGIGSVISMPFAGHFSARFGCRKTLVIAAILSCTGLLVMASASSVPLVAAGLLVFGAGIGSADVSVNIQAVIVEQTAGRPLMSGFHGLFSLGGIAGAGLVTGLLSLGWSPLAAAGAVVALAAILMMISFEGLLPYGGAQGPTFVVPKGHVLLIGALCFVMFMAEGSVLDWSGVLLNTVRGLEKSRAGLGYVAFSIAMTAGRLSGDWVVHRLGPQAIVFLGGLCASLGFALAALVPAWPVTVLGFALVGIGAANVVPVLFTAAGRQTSMPSHLAIAAVSTLGYTGILLGPGLIGFGARAVTLPFALLGVALMLASVAACARSATRA